MLNISHAFHIIVIIAFIMEYFIPIIIIIVVDINKTE